MRIIPAGNVPLVFEERMQERSEGEDASVITMSVSLDDNLVTESLVRYGRSGDVLAVDNYGHRYGYAPRLSLRGFGASHDHHVSSFEERFAGEYKVLNEPRRRIPPFDALLGRSHIKAYSVGNKVLSLGGVNCNTYSFNNNIDILLDFEAAGFSDFLKRFIDADGNMRNLGSGETIQLDEDNEVIVDYGRRRVSPILDRVYADLENDSAKNIVLSSNYIPFGRIDKVLDQHVKNGVNVAVYANTPRKFLDPFHSSFSVVAHSMVAAATRTKWHDNDHDRFNHLKALVIEYTSGESVGYVGSHNFNQASVAAGTSEVCLRTTDPELIEQLLEYIKDNLAA